jgi:hypothetical protein
MDNTDKWSRLRIKHREKNYTIKWSREGIRVGEKNNTQTGGDQWKHCQLEENKHQTDRVNTKYFTMEQYKNKTC